MWPSSKLNCLGFFPRNFPHWYDAQRQMSSKRILWISVHKVAPDTIAKVHFVYSWSDHGGVQLEHASKYDEHRCSWGTTSRHELLLQHIIVMEHIDNETLGQLLGLYCPYREALHCLDPSRLYRPASPFTKVCSGYLDGVARIGPIFINYGADLFAYDEMTGCFNHKMCLSGWNPRCSSFR
jgi:hypothetical protein